MLARNRAPSKPGALSQSPKLSGAPAPNRATRATIALPKSDRPDGREPAMPLPRLQQPQRATATRGCGGATFRRLLRAEGVARTDDCRRGISIARPVPRPTGKQSRGSCHDATTGVIEMSPFRSRGPGGPERGSDRPRKGCCPRWRTEPQVARMFGVTRKAVALRLSNPFGVIGSPMQRLATSGSCP